jgi:hypothetical protein
MRRAAVASVALVAAALACDPRVFLARTELNDELRHDLLVQCCQCLVRRGTAAPGASCAEAFIGSDGGVLLPSDAVVVEPNEDFVADDGDDAVDGREIPCGCGLDQLTCVGRLEAGARIVVPGACIEQPNNVFDAPCERACGGVLTFDPLPAEDPS